MGVKSVLGKIGKVALKVAPYAAMAIPGVGIPLGMAIKGGIGAAQGAMNGGGLKGALLGGGLGAAGGALGGAGGILDKIGPSSGMLAKLGAGAAGKAIGTGVTGKIGGVLGNLASNALGKGGQPLIDTNDWGRPDDKGWKNVAGRAVEQLGNLGKDKITSMAGSRSNPNEGIGPSTGSAMPREMTDTMGSYGNGGYNPVNAGRLAAAKDQGFRRGYDVLGSKPDPTDEIPNPTQPIMSHIPKINTDYASMGVQPRKRKSVMAAL